LQWSFSDLEYEIPQGPSLLRMRVTGKGDATIIRRPVARPRPTCSLVSLLPSELGFGDPVQHGMAAAHSSTSAGVAVSGGSSAAAAEASQEVVTDDEFDDTVGPPDEYDDLPDDQVEDIMEGMAEEVALDTMEAFAPSGPAGGDVDLGDDPVVEAGLAVIAAAEVDAEAEAAAAVVAAELHVAELVASCRIDEKGYIRSPHAPWSEYQPLGRISTWPEKQPLFKRNVGCRCTMHPKCSVTRKRAQVTDQQLLTWLFSVSPCEPLSLPATTQAAGRAHMGLTTMLHVTSASGATGSSA
jgi:hypothetical protein